MCMWNLKITETRRSPNCTVYDPIETAGHCFVQHPSQIFLPGRELLQSPFRTEFSMWSRSHRFGKSTHISKISNSVTHLRSYTHSAIADIAGNSAPISPVTPRDRRRRRAKPRRLCIERRRLRIKRRYHHIEWPPRDRRRRCPKRRPLHIERRRSASSADIVALNDDCFMMFHNVLSVSWCFTMF